MRQLSGVDATLLAMEQPNAPMHVGSLAIYDPSTAKNGKVRFKQILTDISTRLADLPAMTEVLEHVPLKLDHPYWASTQDFNPEFHIRHIALPHPGDWRQLCIQVARIHARPLDLSKPLWEIYIIEGLDNVEGFPAGCFAMLSKVHHATIDGASGGELGAALHDLEANPKAGKQGQPLPIRASDKPSRLKMLARAQANNLRYPLKYARAVRNAVPKIGRTAANVLSGKVRRINRVPRTRFNGKVSAHRVFDSVRLELAEILEIKDRFDGVTVNDVALCIVGGGIRTYLMSKQELPTLSLVAAAPVNLRTEGATETSGNDVTNMSVRLHTEIADPVERLVAIHEGTQQAKSYVQSIGPRTLTDFIQLVPAFAAEPMIGISSRLNLTQHVPPLYNCSVTNVPGPRVPLYFQGAKMQINFGLGPVMDGVGIFNIINSYCNEFSISFTSCREMIPDPDAYAVALKESFACLREAVNNI